MIVHVKEETKALCKTLSYLIAHKYKWLYIFLHGWVIKSEG